MENSEPYLEPSAGLAAVQPLGRTDPAFIGHYPLVGVLGAGWSGRVYLARDPRGRPMAVKAIRPQYADSPVFRARFRRELDVIRRVRSERGAPILDADPDDELPWLAMACVAGPTLEQALDLHGPLPESCVRLLAAHLAEALADLHDAGIVHRDLKPGNVLLDADGPKLIDFGVAHIAAATRLTATGAAVGTPAFIAPEQVSGSAVGPATDVFALGALLVYAATGRPPFGDEAAAVLYARVVHGEPDLSGLDGLSVSLRELIAACLSKDPAARPDARAIVAACAPSAGAPWLSDGEAPWLPRDVSDLVTARRKAIDAVLPGAPLRVMTGAPADAAKRRRGWGSGLAPMRRRAVAIPVGTALVAIVALIAWGIGGGGTVRSGAPSGHGTSVAAREGAAFPPVGGGATTGTGPSVAAGHIALTPTGPATSPAASGGAVGGAVGGAAGGGAGGVTGPGSGQGSSLGGAPVPDGTSSAPAGGSGGGNGGGGNGGGGHSTSASHPPSSAPAPGPSTSTSAPAPPPAPFTCPQHNFCWWSQPSMPGRETGGCVDSSLQHGEWFCSRGFPGMYPPVLSFINNTPYRVWLQQNNSHTNAGTELCVDPGTSVSDLSGNPNTNDRWVWMSNNPAPC